MSQTEQPVRLGILGAGHIGRRHAACAQHIAEAEIAAVWSRTPSSASALAATADARVHTELEALCTSPDVDAVIVCTPTPLHAEMALTAIRHGKHVICEKPLARTLAQAEAMIRAADDAGLHLLAAHVVRFFPAFRRLHDLVNGGRVGQPAVIRMSRATDAPPAGWRADGELSGGALLEMGIHDIDWLLWTCGPAERVFCRATRRGPYSAPDYALTMLRLQSGAITHIESSMVRDQGFRTHGEIASDDGLLTYDSDLDTALQLNLIESEDRERVQIPTVHTVESPYVSQLRHFCRCIRGQEPPLITPQEAHAALRATLGALESAASNRAVSL